MPHTDDHDLVEMLTATLAKPTLTAGQRALLHTMLHRLRCTLAWCQCPPPDAPHTLALVVERQKALGTRS
jgi:hypothetical protein